MHILTPTLQGCTVMKITLILLVLTVVLDSSSLLQSVLCFGNQNCKQRQLFSTMEAKIIALSACCRELFPIIDMVHSLAVATNLPIGNMTVNVSIHEDNSEALCVGQNPASTVHSSKQVLGNQDNLVL
jgi:hypothetical protein